MNQLRFSFFPLKLFLLISFYIATPIDLRAQRGKTQHAMTTDEAKIVKKDAATLFNIANYSGAIKGYLDLVKAEPANADYQYRLGYCYLLTNLNKAKAVDCFEKSIRLKHPKKEALYFLGLAYMYAERWDDAIRLFEEYKVSSNSKPVKDFPDVDRQEEMCENAKELTAHPLNVTFENPGKSINTPYEDYNPCISADGKTLVFSSRRKGNMGGFIEDFGMYSADVYWTMWKDTGWIKAKSAGAGINSEWDEESVGLSADGNQLLAYFDNIDAAGDIAVSTLKGKTWQRCLLLGPPVNLKDYETAASMSLDGSVIFFASERNSKNGSDLFMSVKKDNHEWGPSINLGNVINTKYDEEAPFIAMDGKTLYFSSKGHNSMGGYDVFRSEYDEANETWSEPVNIGYPLNNADDNLFYSTTGNQRTAYVTAVREGGIGDRDIYKVTFNDTIGHPFLSLISGTVSPDANAKIEITKATLESIAEGKEQMTYRPFSPGNEFVFAAKAGEYKLTIEGYNFQTYTETITIPNEFPLQDVVRKITVKAGK